MMNGKPAIGRQQGVRPAGKEPSEVFEPRSVLGMQFVELALVAYSDEQGRRHNNIVYFIDGKPYLDPRGEEWVNRQLTPASAWLATQLTEGYERRLAAASNPSAPIDSTVDVFLETTAQAGPDPVKETPPVEGKMASAGAPKVQA